MEPVVCLDALIMYRSRGRYRVRGETERRTKKKKRKENEKWRQYISTAKYVWGMGDASTPSPSCLVASKAYSHAAFYHSPRVAPAGIKANAKRHSHGWRSEHL